MLAELEDVQPPLISFASLLDDVPEPTVAEWRAEVETMIDHSPSGRWSQTAFAHRRSQRKS